MSRQQIINEFQKFSEHDKRELIRELQNSLMEQSLKPSRSLLELQGLGKGIWKEVDVEEYIRNERNWDRN